MSNHFVRADVRAFLDAMQARPKPQFNDELIAMIRKMQPDPAQSMDLPIGEIATMQNFTMPGPGGDIALRLFDARAEREPGPAVIYFHGGGFVVGSVDLFASLAAEIARSLDLPVISVEYRLAPEHPWPAAPDDAEAATRWIADDNAVFGRTFTGLILAGDSAGGNLCMVTALALRDKPARLRVQMQFLMYPKVDHWTEYHSGQLFNDGYGLSTANIQYYGAAYRPEPSHWRASPILADQTDIPPTLLVTASLDPLRDEGRAYAAKLIAAGVSVTYREVSGTVHGFCGYRRVIPSAREDTRAVLDIARAMVQEFASEAGSGASAAQ